MFAAATLPPQDPVVQEMLIDLGVILRKERDSSFVHGLVIQSMESWNHWGLFSKTKWYIVIIEKSTTISNPCPPCYPIHIGNRLQDDGSLEISTQLLPEEIGMMVVIDQEHVPLVAQPHGYTHYSLNAGCVGIMGIGLRQKV